MSLTNEEKTLINVLKNSLVENKSTINNFDVDSLKLLKLADDHSVSILTFEETSSFDKKIPEESIYDWLYLTSRKMAKNEDVFSAHIKLTKLLEENNIDCFVFKGLTSAYYYSKYELRELGDIDFFVRKEEIEEVNKILIENEFRLISKKDSKHWTYKLGDVEIEMHFGFWVDSDNDCTRFLNNKLSSTLCSPKRYSFDDYMFFGPDCISHALILIMHIINHLQNGGIGLRHLFDFAAFLNSDDFANNLDDILSCFKKGGIYKFAVIIAAICNKYLSTPDFDFIKDYDEELVKLLFLDFVKSGNFGKASREVYYGSNLFTINKRDKSNIFKSVIGFCYQAWPVCKKHKILLVIAPFFIGIRYFFRAISGKRPRIRPIKYVKSGVFRSNLYKKLEFYKENYDDNK